ncbi:MAG: delta-class carbonic anhydrase [Burkholderiaceae bacterium]
MHCKALITIAAITVTAGCVHVELQLGEQLGAALTRADQAQREPVAQAPAPRPAVAISDDASYPPPPAVRATPAVSPPVVASAHRPESPPADTAHVPARAGHGHPGKTAAADNEHGGSPGHGTPGHGGATHTASAHSTAGHAAAPAHGAHAPRANEEAHRAHDQVVADAVIAAQRHRLAQNTADRGFGPQSPRDIDAPLGSNERRFALAPAASELNLCNIHFHRNAEHKGGEFARYAGNGDGKGYGSGYVYSGQLAPSEMKHISQPVCQAGHGGLSPGDTIEVHYVYSSAAVKPGPTLGACLSESVKNPALRVEAQVFVLVTNDNAFDFKHLTDHGMRDGWHQALHIPDFTGTPIEYLGSTTGPGYNEKGSPFQVTWSVRPNIAKVNIASVGEWCKGNVFKEDHAHGVRNLVVNPDLLSAIRR